MCRNCELATVGDFNCLPGVGEPRAKVMIIGDAPEPADDKQGMPFRGLPGRKLEYLLRRAKVPVDAVWFTYAVKCKPPRGKRPMKRNWKACQPHVAQEIAWIKPKVIVTMGGVATDAQLPYLGGLGDGRGFPHAKRGPDGAVSHYVLPTYGPKYALAVAERDDIIVRDLKMAYAMATGQWTPEPLNARVRVCTTVDEVRALVEELEQLDDFSFDLETSGLSFLKDRILCFAYGLDDTRAAIVPYEHTFKRKGVDTKWTPAELAEVKALMERALVSRAGKTMHHGKFDVAFLRRYKIRCKNFDFDTMLAHHLIDVNKPHDLLFVAQWYGLVEEQYNAALEEEFRALGKRDFAAVTPSTLYHYAGCDAVVTHRLRRVLADRMERLGVLDIFYEISMPLGRVSADMEYRGARIDAPRMLKMGAFAKRRAEQLTKRVFEASKGEIVNPNSRKQILAFFKKRGILKMPNLDNYDRNTGPKLTKSGNLSVDDEVLTKLAAKSRANGVPELISEIRTWVRMRGTYLDGKKGNGGMYAQLDERGFLHTHFNVHGTISGRLSSSKPNLQNIPRDIIFKDKHGADHVFSIRGLFIPDEPGDEFLSVDYKQLELRVAAALSRDPVLLQEIRDGVDLHSRNAALLFLRISEEAFLKVYKDETHPLYMKYKGRRDDSKTVMFGTIYGSSAHGVSKRNNIPLEDAERFVRGLFRKYKVLGEYIEQCNERVRATAVVRTQTGRLWRAAVMRWANDRLCPRDEARKKVGDVERVSVNLPIQSWGSDVYSRGKIAVWRELRRRKLKSRLVLTIHDGGLINVKPDEKDEVAEIVQRCMTTKLNAGTRYEVELPVDIKFAPQWGFVEDEDAFTGVY